MRKILIIVMVCAFYACADTGQFTQLKTASPGTGAAVSIKKSNKNARTLPCSSEDTNCIYNGVGMDPDTGIWYDVNLCTNSSTGQQESCFDQGGGTGGSGGSDHGVDSGTDNGDPATAAPLSFHFPANPTDGDLFFPYDPITHLQTNYRFIYSYCAQMWVRGGPVFVKGTPPANPTCGTLYSNVVSGQTLNYVYSAWCSSSSSSRTFQTGWYYAGPGSTGVDGCGIPTGAPGMPSSTITASFLTKMNHSYYDVYMDYSIDGGNTWVQMAGSSLSMSLIISGAFDDVYQFRARVVNAPGMYGHPASNIYISTPWGSTTPQSWSDPQYNPDGTPASFTTLPSPGSAIHSSCTIFVYVQ